MGPWNAKENGSGSFPNPGGDSLTQNLRNQLNKSGQLSVYLQYNYNINVLIRPNMNKTI